MRITSKGQVTIPKKMRERLVRVPNARQGEQLMKNMRGAATSAMTTDEIMQLTRG